ncbi:MAG: chromate resistance protein ChrB domain-containing protein [Candidatus Angelobacter sp.]
MLVFTLPTAKASERVGVWRKLQRYGTIQLPASGHILPHNPVNQERFEWLATSIRNSKGHAAVAQVSSFDELENEQLEQMFINARTRDYQSLEKDMRKLGNSARRTGDEAALVRFKRRLQQIAEIDFFGSPARARLEAAMQRLETTDGVRPTRRAKEDPEDYIGRTWVTRPHPGIDRVSSAWLITKFIDPQAKFIFDADAKLHPKAIPFDMFNAGGFGHVGNDCTFETLLKTFGVKDSRLKLLAHAVHDADLADDHFGRNEALGVDRILDGSNKQGLPREEVLRKGMEIIDGLYNGIR